MTETGYGFMGSMFRDLWDFALMCRNQGIPTTGHTWREVREDNGPGAAWTRWKESAILD